jgi:hypothetical protein
MCGGLRPGLNNAIRSLFLELARRDSALDRKSRQINDLGSSVPDNDASPDLFCPAFYDQLHLRAGRLRNGAVFRGDNPDGF